MPQIAQTRPKEAGRLVRRDGSWVLCLVPDQRGQDQDGGMIRQRFEQVRAWLGLDLLDYVEGPRVF